MISRIIPIFAGCLLFASVSWAQPEEASNGILLKGVNGQEVTASGVLEARPEGMVFLIQGHYEPITVDWAKFDLEFIEKEQPTIYYAYQDAQRFQRPFLIKLGTYEGILSFEEAIQQLNHELNKPRFFPLPSNVNYLIEQDPDVIRAKSKDINRYNKLMRDQRGDLEEFLRRIFPSESIIIDDSGNLHQKDRPGSVDPNRGESSLSLIFTVLSDNQKAPSRRGLQYLREVTTLQSDVDTKWSELRAQTQNPTFEKGNIDHTQLPILLGESQASLDRVLEATHLHQSDQQKLSDFIAFVYSHAPKFR